MSKTTGCIMKTFTWVAGIAALVYGIYFLMMDTSKWPQIEAVVISSVEGMSDENSATTYDTYYEIQVDGIKYEDSINGYTQYNKGDKITVYYDPNDPTTTVMSRGELGFLGCVGVLFGLFTIGSMAWGAIKARGKTETPDIPS
jgi:hypothetical protein